MEAESAPSSENPAGAATPSPEPKTSGKPMASPDGPTSGQTVWVIDAPGLIFRRFHAMPAMSNPEGVPTGALRGFVDDIFQILTERKPDYLFCCFDPDTPTFRHTVYPEYKGHRPDMPVDLSPQFPLIREFLEIFDIPALEIPEFEADDVLATIARDATERDACCVIVSSDKDCRQLLNGCVTIYNLSKRQMFGIEDLWHDWGVRPDQVVDFQALTGDSVDNVPGVPLIGPKAAQTLLEEFGTLDAVLDAAAEGKLKKSKKHDNLVAYREQAEMSRTLCLLEDSVPFDIPWDQARPGNVDLRRAEDFFRRMDFRSLTDQMRKMNLSTASAEWEHTYHTIDTPEKFDSFLKELSEQKQFAVDTETTSLRARDADLVGMSFCWKPGEAYYLPVRAPEGETVLPLESTLAALKPILEDPAIGKVGQNIKYDLIIFRTVGIELQGIAFDSMVASYLLDPGQRSHGMDELSHRYLSHPPQKLTELIGTGKNQKTTDQVPVAAMSYYAAEDADVTLRLKPCLEPLLAEQELTELFHSVEIPLVDVLAEMEFNGVAVNLDRLGEMSRQYGEAMVGLEQEIYELAGHEFNINSPKQLGTVLFEELKLPVRKKVTTGASTDADVLAELASRHPLPAKVMEYRQYSKLKGTYLDALPTMVSPRTGRVHASFNQHVAATGRLSSSDPNLQNIPIRTDLGREIRSAFTAGEPDWLLLTADYSQIELRILAHYTQDENLQQAFAEDQDIHVLVASHVYGVSLEEVTKDMRRAAKTVNFGIIYGQSAFGLAQRLGIDQLSAEQFITAYFGRYPRVDEFLAATLDDARENRYVKTILGRRRPVSGVRASVGRQRNVAERTAINTVIQGSAADIIKLAMLSVHRRLREENLKSRLLLQIHDELVFEAPREEMPRLAKLVDEAMSGVLELSVPLKVDLSVGPNWLETVSYSEFERGGG